MLNNQISKNSINLDLNAIKELVDISNRLTSLVSRLAKRHNLDLDELEQNLDSRVRGNDRGKGRE